MNTTKSIYSTRCWLNNQLQPATISYENGVITAIHQHKTDGAEDVGDNILMPGIIDAHVHINEPGRTDWEGFETATQAAAAGGITTIVDMPLNASPVTTTVKAFNQKLDATKNKLHVNVGFYGGLVPDNVNDLEALIKSGVLGIKCFLTHSGIDEFPNVGEQVLNEAMPIIAKHNIPLLAHCEIESAVICDFSKFPNNYQQYLASRPKSWENDAVDLMIKLCRKFNCSTHIVHVSSAEALDKIAAAKNEGLQLTAETCPHYIFFDAENIPDANCLYKCAPPIREKENNNLLQQALKNGVLNFIATDHSPAPPNIKEIESGNLQKAWGGIAGLQFLLPVSWSALKETMTIEQFIPLLTAHPAHFLKLDNKKGEIKTGHHADFVIWAPEEKFVVHEADVLHRHRMNPYNGLELFGVIKQTIVNGEAVYKNKMVDTNKKYGKIILAI